MLVGSGNAVRNMGESTNFWTLINCINKVHGVNAAGINLSPILATTGCINNSFFFHSTQPAGLLVLILYKVLHEAC